VSGSIGAQANAPVAFELVVDSHQQLLSQLSENQQVQKVRRRFNNQEFNNLSEDARIYKRMGPVLVPQEFSEAKVNVNKRIEFIQSEMYVVMDLRQ